MNIFYSKFVCLFIKIKYLKRRKKEINLHLSKMSAAHTINPIKFFFLIVHLIATCIVLYSYVT